jgi:protein-S-isoprenylcysteine O-methyltransferase Ste14
MPFAFPIAIPQFWLFNILSLIFCALIVGRMIGRPKESGGHRETRSRTGIVLQSVGIGLACFGNVRPILPWLSPAAIAAYVAIVLLMGGAIALFASSSIALGKNWSLEARTLDDHDLIRTGPYARIRHPIYLAMLMFLLGLAVALGHYAQLLIAIPIFVVGTRIRTDAEDRLLEQSFGDAFRQYRNSTPALFPKIG